MIKKTIKFRDYDDNEIEETHYFNLSKRELIDMTLETEGEEDLAVWLQRISESGNAKLIIKTFRDIVAKSYGTRDDTNPTRFYKSEEQTNDFMNSMAFDALFEELMTNGSAAAQFIAGMIPKDMAADKDFQRVLAEQAPTLTGPRPITDVDLERAQIAGDPTAIGGPAKVTVPHASGLRDPLDSNGQLVPWAYRKPTAIEQMQMTKEQLVDVMNRSNTGWQPRNPE